MIMTIIGLVTSAHAQYPSANGYANYGGQFATPAGCHSVVDGKFEFVSGVPGCTEKRRSSSGDSVTFQLKMPLIKEGSKKVTYVDKVFTQNITKKDGQLVMSSYEGEDVKKASAVTTGVYNGSATTLDNSLAQTLVTQRRDGKEQKFLVYDRNLCARFREAGTLQRDLESLRACATVLPKFEDAAREWEAKLKKDKVSLGVAAGYTAKGTVYRPAAAGSINDLIAIAGACQQIGLKMDFNFGDDDHASGGRGEMNDTPCVGCKPPSNSGVSH